MALTCEECPSKLKAAVFIPGSMRRVATVICISTVSVKTSPGLIPLHVINPSECMGLPLLSILAPTVGGMKHGCRML